VAIETFFQITRASCVDSSIIATEYINVEEFRGCLVFIGWHIEVFLGGILENLFARRGRVVFSKPIFTV